MEDNMIRQFKIAVFCMPLILAAIVSCSTMRKDFIYTASSKTDNIRAAEEIEKAIVLQGESKNAQALENIKKDLDSLLSSPSSDSGYLALVYALYGDYYLLKNNKAQAKKMLRIAEKYNPYEEYVELLVARLMPPEDAAAYLSKKIEANPSFYRLGAQLGAVQYTAGNYTEALVAFDGALEFLPKEYRVRYGKLRDYCSEFHTVDKDIKKTTAQILKQDRILLIDMAVLTQDNTHALDFITGTAQWKPKMLADRLKAAGWYAADLIVQEDYAKRKDAALFLWRLIAGTDSRMLSKYSRKYANRDKLPLADVAMDGVYFDSVLGTVEEDVIPLVGGKMFDPDGSVSGLEFYNWLKKADVLR